MNQDMARLMKWIWKLIPKSRWCISYLNKRSVIFSEETVGKRERVTTDEERVPASGLKRTGYTWISYLRRLAT